MEKSIWDIEIQQHIAEAWFKVIGFLAALTAMELAQKKTDSILIECITFFSYGALFFWLQAITSKFIWHIKPGLRPTGKILKTGREKFKTYLLGTISGVITIIIYITAQSLVGSFVSAK